MLQQTTHEMIDTAVNTLKKEASGVSTNNTKIKLATAPRAKDTGIIVLALILSAR